MIVWGGFYSEHVSSMIGEGTTEYAFGDGGRYNPVTDTWNSVSATAAPAARYRAAAVWANTRMIVWGVGDQNVLGSGGRYDPAANTWASVSTVGAPAARMDPTAVWTGSRMVVWGVRPMTALGTGGRYDPSANTWASVSAWRARRPAESHLGLDGFAHAGLGREGHGLEAIGSGRPLRSNEQYLDRNVGDAREF